MENYTPIKVEKTSIINLGKGKIPPNASDLEEAVLGAVMIDNRGLNEAMEFLFPDIFYKEPHRLIFEAVLSLFNKNEAIDLLTISNELKRVGKLDLAGGDFYLIQLTQKVSSSAHIEYHSRILLQKYVQRKCISTSSELIENSYNEDVDIFELLEKVYKDYGLVSDLITVGKVENFRDNVHAFLNNSGSGKSGIPSSLSKLNKKLNGYQNSDLIILAARPGMGKTAFVLNEILECGLNNIPVAFFSLEMSTKQIIGRLLSIISGIDITKIYNFNLSHEEVIYLKKCSDLLASLPIFIDDKGGISPIELKIKANKLKREHGIKMIVVDYLQLMRVKNKKMNNKENEVSEISSSLKNLAKDLDVPVIALSQLSRNVEQRGAGKRPMLSDLRDSGSIEQDADIVLFIYRPEYYKIDQWDDEEASPTENTAEIDVAKYRNGETGYCRTGCELKYMRFMDIENLGQDLRGKYFRNSALPELIENKEFELPKINPKDAFGDSDVPF